MQNSNSAISGCLGTLRASTRHDTRQHETPNTTPRLLGKEREMTHCDDCKSSEFLCLLKKTNIKAPRLMAIKPMLHFAFPPYFDMHLMRNLQMLAKEQQDQMTTQWRAFVPGCSLYTFAMRAMQMPFHFPQNTSIIARRYRRGA